MQLRLFPLLFCVLSAAASADIRLPYWCQAILERAAVTETPFAPLPPLDPLEAYALLRSREPTPESVRFMMTTLLGEPDGPFSERIFRALRRLKPMHRHTLAGLAGALALRESNNAEHRAFANAICEEIFFTEHLHPMAFALTSRVGPTLVEVLQIARERGFDGLAPVEGLLRVLEELALHPTRYRLRSATDSTLAQWIASSAPLSAANARRLYGLVYGWSKGKALDRLLDSDEEIARLLLALQHSGAPLKAMRPQREGAPLDIRQLAYDLSVADEATILKRYRTLLRGPDNFMRSGAQILVLDRVGDPSPDIRSAALALLVDKYSLLKHEITGPGEVAGRQLFLQTLDANPVKARASRDLLTSLLVHPLSDRVGAAHMGQSPLLVFAASADLPAASAAEWAAALLRFVLLHNDSLLQAASWTTSELHRQSVAASQSAIRAAAERMLADPSAAVQRRGRFILVGTDDELAEMVLRQIRTAPSADRTAERHQKDP